MEKQPLHGDTELFSSSVALHKSVIEQISNPPSICAIMLYVIHQIVHMPKQYTKVCTAD